MLLLILMNMKTIFQHKNQTVKLRLNANLILTVVKSSVKLQISEKLQIASSI